MDGKRTALLCCPDCFSTGTLETHTIAADGLVSPSVRCNEGCDYHQTGVRLEGWQPS